MFYLMNQKFQHEARKAVFSELSLQLEYYSEDLKLDTDLQVFDDMIEIIKELKTQAVSHRCNKPTPKEDPMQKFKDLPVTVKFEQNEVKF